jgi:prolyl-tRNA editing enzyme YbaK/EbsC (Cys-tRNA(Pro) deacylase)
MAEIQDHPAVGRVQAALRSGGSDGTVVVLDEHARTAQAAAEQLGVPVAQIANSLVFAVPDQQAPGGLSPVLVLTSGGHRVDTAKLAEVLGVAEVRRAAPDFVRERTGSAIGGVAPVGHPAPIRTLLDVALQDHPEIWAAAGHPRTVFRTSFTELRRLTGAQAAEVG